MANKNVKLKNKNGDYLYPYTDNIPTASTSAAGKVRLDSSPTSGSNNAITSGAVYTALSTKANDSAVAHKAGAETFTALKTLQVSNDDAWIIKKANGDNTQATQAVQTSGAFRVTDKNGKIMGDVRFVRTTGGTQSAILVARNAVTGTEINCIMSCNVDKDGNIYTSAPVPAENDNSTKIATTNWTVAKINKSLVSRYVVTERYMNGTSWYRIWSDGWIEQGGTVITSLSEEVVVTFLKPFQYMTYTLIGTRVTGGISGNTISLHHLSTSTFGANSAYIESRRTDLVSWYACGY